MDRPVEGVSTLGSVHDYIPIQTTRRYREAQTDEKFLSWLRMQEAATELIFVVDDVPELRRNDLFSPASLAVVEQKLLDTFPTKQDAWATPENTDLAMRYVYYIGETIRRATEGTWAALPEGTAALPAVDVPYDEVFVQPADLLNIALVRRSGNEISQVLGYAIEDHNAWVAADRPPRVFRGTLRED